MQGATAPFISAWPKKLLMFGEDMQSDQLHVPANYFISLGMASGKPRTTKSISNCFSNQTRTFGLQFDVTLNLYGFCMFLQSVKLGAIWLCWKGRVSFHLALICTGYGDGNFHCFSGPISDLFLSGFKGLFLHVRCVPQHNSQWQFWASVCVCGYLRVLDWWRWKGMWLSTTTPWPRSWTGQRPDWQAERRCEVESADRPVPWQILPGRLRRSKFDEAWNWISIKFTSLMLD